MRQSVLIDLVTHYLYDPAFDALAFRLVLEAGGIAPAMTL